MHRISEQQSRNSKVQSRRHPDLREKIPPAVFVLLTFLMMPPESCLAQKTVQIQNVNSETSRQKNEDLHACRSKPVEFDLWREIRRLLLPRRQHLTYELREYISGLPQNEQGTRLRDDRSRLLDLRRVDCIYQQAVFLSEGDINLALFLCTVATLPYHRFPAVIPILDLEIVVPVSTESRDAYATRLEKLPGMLFSDTPSYLDKDKLPHFFGAAYLQVMFRDPMFVEDMGLAIEHAEEVFKLEGFSDERDLRANRLGILFAVQLQKGRHVLPSQLFLKSGKPAGVFIDE